MGKKYYQDREDRKNESKGMKKYMKDSRKGRFAEGHDEGIGRNDYAGMPNDVKMESYPRTAKGDSGYQDDTMSGIDYVSDTSAQKRNRNMSYQK